MSLENIIDREFEVLDQTFYDYLAEKMAAAVLECGNKVPVVTGTENKIKKYIKGGRESGLIMKSSQQGSLGLYLVAYLVR